MDYQVISRKIDIRTVFSVIVGYMLAFLLVANYCFARMSLVHYKWDSTVTFANVILLHC